MVSVGTLITSVIISAVVTAVVTIFVYRNNTKSIGGVADKVDDINDILKDK
jgi:signal transduction histidine kinase